VKEGVSKGFDWKWEEFERWNGKKRKKKGGIIEKKGYKWWNSKKKDLKRFLHLEGGRFKVCKRWSNIWKMFERGLKLEKGS